MEIFCNHTQIFNFIINDSELFPNQRQALFKIYHGIFKEIFLLRIIHIYILIKLIEKITCLLM